MLGSIASSIFQRNIVGALILSLTLGVGLSVMPTATNQAFADDFGPAEIGTESKSSSQKGADPVPQRNGSSCEKPIPANPKVICGYARFGQRLDVPGAASFRRQAEGLPQLLWNGWSNGYSGQGQGKFINVYDPTLDAAVAPNHSMSNPTNTAYYSTGVWWKEYRYWMPAQKNRSTRTVSAPGWDYEIKETKKTVRLPFWPYTTYETVEKTFIRVPGTPKTVHRLIINDQTVREGATVRTNLYPVTLRTGDAPVTVTEFTLYPKWTNRVVSYGGVSYPSTPKITTSVCATSVGPGYMTGPFENDATSPWPVPTGVGTYDPQTEPKIWNTRPRNASSNPLWREGANGEGILYSNLGILWKEDLSFAFDARSPFPPEWNSYMSYIENCPDVSYRVSALDQSCRYIGTTFPQDYNRLFPAGSKYCGSFTPGNYRKQTTGETSTCQIAELYWDTADTGERSASGRRHNSYTYALYPHGQAAYKKVFLGCSDPEVNRSAARNNWAHWLCNDTTGAVNRNETYNFANCSGPRRDGRVDVADEYRCVAADNGNPAIIDVESGSRTGSISQMLANGKQIQVRWPEPTGISVLSGGVLSRVQTPENMWQNWEVVAGSEPINDNLPISDRNQSIFGSYLANVNPENSESVLGGPGKDEWDTPWIYLRGYKSAPVNTTGSNIRVGTQTIAPDETIPLGLTTTFNATVQRTVSTGLGGSLEINVPVICKMPDAYLYVVSGRATD